MKVSGFAPILGSRPRVLILGSAPSVASLAAGEYYGHPRNAFWSIMGSLYGAGPDLSYEQRCQRLTSQGIAVWDVLAHCERSGSLDASIKSDTEVSNPIAELLETTPTLRLIALNGGKAASSYQRHVLSDLQVSLPYKQLPSTSPANASWSKARKLQAWRTALAAVTTGSTAAQRRQA